MFIENYYRIFVNLKFSKFLTEFYFKKTETHRKIRKKNIFFGNHITDRNKKNMFIANCNKIFVNCKFSKFVGNC